MKKREFLKVTGVVTAGSIMGASMLSCQNGSGEGESEGNATQANGLMFELPALGYAFNALEPNIDAQTMEIHHDKHHAGYVRKFNAALEEKGITNGTLEEIISGVGANDTGLRNNGGGHYNHSLFWEIMSPAGGGKPTGNLNDAIKSSFGSFDSFKEQFSNAAKGRFGSGWAWLAVDDNNKLFITDTPNQDNPLMSKLVENTGTPILGIDVWEHAYYLKYQNKRGDYINNFFNVINWEEVAKRYSALMG